MGAPFFAHMELTILQLALRRTLQLITINFACPCNHNKLSTIDSNHRIKIIGLITALSFSNHPSIHYSTNPVKATCDCPKRNHMELMIAVTNILRFDFRFLFCHGNLTNMHANVAIMDEKKSSLKQNNALRKTSQFPSSPVVWRQLSKLKVDPAVAL